MISAGLDWATNRKAASYYTYDINGNVEQLVQENNDLVTAEGGFVTGDNVLKTIRYEYDLISGKVNQVLYQTGKWDQYSIRNQYDAENRLVKGQALEYAFTEKFAHIIPAFSFVSPSGLQM